MPQEEAEKIIKNGEVTQSDKHPGYPLCVDDTYYFEATLPKPKKEPKTVTKE